MDVSPEELLDLVVDRESLLAFVLALSGERRRAEVIEKDHPDRYIVDGALGWMNGDIQNFLEACIYSLEDGGQLASEQPSW